MIRLRTLGALGLSGPDGTELRAVLTQPKRLALLCYLAIASPPGFRRRDKLLALFWPELDEEHARNALNRAVYYLRQALGANAVESRGGDELGISARVVWCDATTFAAALDAGKPSEALELYRGELLPGLFIDGSREFERWLEAERARLGRRAVDAALALSESEEAKGQFALATHWARQASAFAPYDEKPVRRLIAALDRSGDLAAAILAYDDFARRLKEDLEVEPSTATTALITELRARQVLTRHPAAGPTPELQPVQKAVAPRSPGTRAWRAGNHRAMRIGAVLLLLLVSVGGWWIHDQVGHADSLTERKSVAVLPFTNLSADPENDYFSAGVVEDISAQLGKIAGLKVMSRSAVDRHLQARKSLREMAESLSLAGALWGSIRRAGDSIRVVARLEDPRTGEQLWAETYDRELKDVFAIQSDVAQKIATALQAQLSPGEKGRIQKKPTENIEAYGYTLRAEDLLRAVPTNADIALATDLLKKAVKLDSGFGRAFRDLADLYYWRANRTSNKRPLLDSARAFASKALASDIDTEERAVVYRVIAITYADQRLFRQSLAFNLKAAELNPNYFSGAVGVAELSFQTGDFVQSLSYAKKAQALKPNNQLGHFFVARAYVALDDFARARHWASKTVELYPDDPEARLISVDVHLAAGEFSLAAADIEDVLEKHAERPQSAGPDEGLVGVLQYGLENAVDVGDYAKARDYHRRLKAAIAAIAGQSEPDWWFDHPEFICKTANTNWGYVIEKTGHSGEAEAIFDLSRKWDEEQLKQGSEDSCNAYDLAAIDAAQGGTAGAYRELQRAIAAGWRHYRFAMHDPLLESLRTQPEFERMMSAVRSKVNEMRARVAAQGNIR